MGTTEAVVFTETGGPEVIALKTVGFLPTLAGDDLLIDVTACGLNRADVLQRKGFYPAPPGVAPDVPGLEFVGTVAATGPNASRKPGARVMGILAGGGMQRQLVTRDCLVMDVPGGLSDTDAAAIPEVFLTAHDALFDALALTADDTLLIHAVGSGVGTAAVQLAHAVGAKTIGTTRSAHKLDLLNEKLGKAGNATLGIAVTDKCFAKAVGSHAPHGVDCVLDLVGAAYLDENMKAMADKGRMVTLGLLGGAKAELPLALLLAKRLNLMGRVLRSRSDQEKAALTASFAERFLAAFSTKALVPVVDRVMPMSAIQQAHQVLESSDTFGKIVMAWT